MGHWASSVTWAEMPGQGAGCLPCYYFFRVEIGDNSMLSRDMWPPIVVLIDAIYWFYCLYSRIATSLFMVRPEVP